MNTPSHLILNLALLRRPVTPVMTWPILIGAIIPDAALFVFYAYYSQPWQDIFAVGNSMPLGLLAIALSYYLKRQWLGFVGASMVLHHLADLPLHHDDAHRHFWPLSSVRFISPISYWDADHFGRLGATLELVLVLLATAYLLPRLSSRRSQGLLGTMAVLLALAYLLFVKPFG